MINESLLNYIKLSKKSGKSDEQIRQSLLTSSSGWQAQDINEAFNALEAKPSENTKSISSLQNYHLKFVTILIVVLLVGGYIAAAQFGLVPGFQEIKNKILVTQSTDNELSLEEQEEVAVEEKTLTSVEEAKVEALAIKETPTSWKTYTSNEYGFEFKYPPDLKVLPVGKMAAGNQGVGLWKEGYSGQDIILIGRSESSLQTNIDNIKSLPGFKQTSRSTNNIDWSVNTVKELATNSDTIYFLAQKEKYVYMIILRNYSARKDLADSIVSSFKLLTPPTTINTKTSEVPSSWKTYTNTEYGFEFKYPNNYIIWIDVSENNEPIEPSSTSSGAYMVFHIAENTKLTSESPNIDLIEIHIENTPATLEKRFGKKPDTKFLGLNALQPEKESYDKYDMWSIVFKKNNDIFSIVRIGANPTLDQILSTFKLTK